ncbi:MAG: hypothetical protein V8T35_12990 [Prevotella sp.]
MELKIAINIENAHGWHIGNNIFGGSFEKKSSDSSSGDNLNDADFDVVDDEPRKAEPPISGYVGRSVVLPAQLKSEKAKKILMGLVRIDVLDENFQPSSKLTCYTRGYLARRIADALEISNVWVFFGDFWHLKSSTLRSKYNESLGMKKTLEFEDLIHNIINVR